MIVSLDWLGDYVDLPPVNELTERLLLAGLNHEATEAVGADTAVDLEVTSNRPDCLGHIGVAREIAVLYSRPLRIPAAELPEAAAKAAVAVEIEAGDICPYYSARVIRGVTIGPSPDWLVRRLATVGIASVNNVVDITNYVMFECGQPLHAFDLARLAGRRIVVRRARSGEPFVAINHKQYELTDEMCVIADGSRPVALAGVMGGADTEITPATTDVLLESAQFAPLPVRTAARRLVLGSPSSYRFERGPDPAAVDWASRRATALILELAGGQLDGPVVETGRLACRPATIRLRPARVAEVLGVAVPSERQREILQPLGFVEQHAGDEATDWLAPTWRRDCWREIDLVEEIARVEGYDRVPEDVAIAARPVQRSARERLVRMVGEVCVAAGFCEAMTRSVVAEPLEAWGSPWGRTAALVCRPPLVRGADRLRRTLLPSLAEARAGSLAAGAAHGDLFEIARAYLQRPEASGAADSPVAEPLLLAAVTGGDFFKAKGLAAAVLRRLGLPESAAAALGDGLGQSAAAAVGYRPLGSDLFVAGRAAEIVLCRPELPERRIGVVGELAENLCEASGLTAPVAAIELRLDGLEFLADAEPERLPLSGLPAIDRDINLVVAESVPWAAVVAAIESVGCRELESIGLGDIWRDAERLGPDKKSLVVSLRLRSHEATLSADQANSLVADMVTACTRATGGVLRR
jgi:phenylalanyl-tRNA synthetase beta chain